MAKWEDITSTLKKGVDFVGNKSKELVAITHLNNELGTLNKEKEEKLTNLGTKVYQLVQEGKLSNEELNEVVAEITEFEKKIIAKKEQIEQVRKISQEKMEKKESEVEVLEPEGCGHEIPDNASFCPTCGRKVER